MKTNNGSLPAMPTSIDAQTLACEGRMNTVHDLYKNSAGMTKREMFAMAAMQGMLGADINWGKTLYSDLCSDAVLCADALLAELEKSNG